MPVYFWPLTLHCLCGLLLQTKRSPSVGRSVTVVSPAKTVEPIEMPFGFCGVGWAQGTTCYGSSDLPREEAILRGEGAASCKLWRFCRKLCKNSWTAIEIRLGFGLGRAQESMYWVGCTLAPPDEYHWTVHVRRRCGLLSNFFDHLL